MTNLAHAAMSVGLDRLVAEGGIDDELVRSVATGFDPLDSVLDGGFLPEELVVLGGRPGVGKTIVLVQWARHLATQGVGVVMGQYEHSELAMLTHLCLLELGANADPTETIDARRTLVDVAGRRVGWEAARQANPHLDAAADAVAAYAPNISLLTLEGQSSGLRGLVSAADAHPDATVLFVDHLAKVDPQRSQIGTTADRLKRMAVEREITVVASTVLDDSGIGARRLRMAHLEAAAPVGHEADVVLIANEKLSAVSRNHSAFDSTRIHGMRNQLLLTIEKNRRGVAGVDLEFTRDYAHRRLDPIGGFVTEMLVDDLLVRE